MRRELPKVYTIEDALPGTGRVPFDTPEGVAYLVPMSGDGDGVVRLEDGTVLGHLDASVRYRYEGPTAADVLDRGWTARSLDRGELGEYTSQSEAIEVLIRAAKESAA
jgi:hypothetical protein